MIKKFSGTLLCCFSMLRFSIVTLLVLVFSINSWAYGANSSSEKIELNPNGQVEWSYSGGSITRAAIGDPDVASLSVINRSTLLISATTVGETSLLVWGQGQQEPIRKKIHVVPSGIQVSDIQVQTDIKVVEISKSALKEAGFFFGKSTGNTTIGIGSGDVAGPLGNLFGNSSVLPFSDAFNIVLGNQSKGILGAISALNSNGFAYTLAEPSLVTMSGHSATFLAGGEFPYPVSSDNGDISIEFKEFGVRLSLSPTVREDGRILLKVAPEVSELNYSQGVSSSGILVPGISVRRTDTTIQLGDGESFVISGLISSSTMKNADRLPGLGDIPIIGAFFSASRLEQNDKELMMVVTPHLVKPLAKNTPLPTLPGDVYRRYNPNFFELIFLNKEPDELPQGIGFSDGM
ncbi:type II and III secretion system protein family protein [Vibrio sp.]|uniref:type II and III secretion system protein family protein n=1 Tax=Vibrio sp. TaxID=678 RepID=UPI003AA91311